MSQANASAASRSKTVDFAAVRRDIEVDWFFENILGAKAKPVSDAIRYSICPECGAASEESVKVCVKDGKWKCFACNEHGDVIEAAARFWRMSLKDAGPKLVEEAGKDPDQLRSYRPPKPLPAVKREDSALGDVFSRLVAACPEPSQEVIDYLGSRGIPAEIVRDACHLGILASLPAKEFVARDFLCDIIGRDLLFKAGLWREGAKMPAIAYRPLVLVSNNRRAGEFRYLRPARPDERKLLRYGAIAPWGWRGKSDKRILITEGCIDLLSAVALGTERSIFGLPGCENWRPEWFTRFRGADVMTAFDDDEAGHKAEAKIRPVLESAIGGPFSRFKHPPGATDINEVLQQKLRLAA